MHGFPFDSQIVGSDESGLPLYDRASNSEELARLIHAFFTDGIFGTGGFACTAAGGMEINVSGGDVLIQGRYRHMEESTTLELTSAAQARIATVVLRLDLSLSVRDIVLDVVYGSASASPAPPALTRDQTMYELGICNVLIPANASAIPGKNLTDTRLNNARCGYVVAAMESFQTSTFYYQIQQDLMDFQQREQAEFETWFAGLQTILDGDVAANLASMVMARPVMHVSEAYVASGLWIEHEIGEYTMRTDADVQVGDTVIVDVTGLTLDNHAAVEAAWSAVWKAEVVEDGSIDLFASAAPALDLNLKVVAYRMEVGM